MLCSRRIRQVKINGGLPIGLVVLIAVVGAGIIVGLTFL